MTMASFTPRVLSGVMQDLGDNRVNFLTNSIFTRRATHGTGTIDIGKLTADARLAPYARPGQSAIPVSKMAGSLDSFTAPIIREKKPLDEEFFASLNPGLVSYVGPYTDPNSQIAEKIAMELRDLRKRADKTIEQQCAQALMLGTVTVTYDDASTAAITMGYTGDGTSAGDGLTIQPTLTGTSAWTSASAKPLDDLDRLARQIRQRSDWDGVIDVLMGYAACNLFINHKNVIDKLDTNNLAVGALSLTEQAVYKGRIKGFRIWEHSGGYMSGVSTWNDMFDPYKVCLFPAGSDYFSVEFGAIWERTAPGANPQFIRTEYFGKTVQNEDPASTDLVVETRPLAVVRNPRAVRVLTVGAA